MDAADYVLIGCWVSLSLLIVLLVVSVVRDAITRRRRARTPMPIAIVYQMPYRTGDLARDYLARVPTETITIGARTRCRVAQVEGRQLVVRALGCDRCSATPRLCDPVNATDDEVEALEHLRRLSPVRYPTERKLAL